ncbi:LuxR C-terminal-related transcriptional regulator [Streptomyces sp. NPDC048623]|uniref:LuxR C-terminal-related transcriptional regulator n=1 Tax=Streptomyces sp. NPDC048623 TaxID=3155761 RepID=UPI00342EB618
MAAVRGTPPPGPALPGVALPGVDPLGDPFLRTRFVPPARPATFLRRERLAEHLGQALHTPLTVVEGCAGAGKTLLVADWADRLGRPVAWLTLDAAIQGPGMFWAHFLQALRAAGVPLPTGTGTGTGTGIGTDAPAVTDPLATDPPTRSGRAAAGDHTLPARLAAELGGLDRPVTVVIDEFDRMTAPETARQLEFVLHHGGAGLRLVLVTRTEPLLPLHRYRLAGQITEIRDAELAFTPDEAVTLLALHGLDLPAAAAGDLVERTRGWAAGLRLSAMAAVLSPDPELYLKEFEAGSGTIADFLLAEVLERQPPRTQDLLLRVSLLDRFHPDLADALTGRRDAAGILAGLLHDNAFVEDFGHGWYGLHPLFREILRAHLRRRSPGLERQLHRRAARWLRQSGALPETLAQGAAAGDWTFAARALVDDLAIGQLFSGPRSDELEALFAGLGAETPGPAADLVRAARDLARHDLDRGLAHLRHAEERLTTDARDTAARLGCALLTALAARLSGSPHQAEQAARTASDLLRTAPARLLDEHPEFLALLRTHLGSSRLWAGHVDEAQAALTAVTRGPGVAATALPRRDALEHLALIDCLDGRPGRAERGIRAATAAAEGHGPSVPAGTGLGRVVLAAVALERGENARAEALLRRPPGTPDADQDRGPHQDREPNPARQPNPESDPVTAAARRLATARLLLAQGRVRAALATAEQVVPAAEDSPWAQTHAALVVSAARLAEGDPEAAAEALRAVAGDQPVVRVGAARVHLAAGDPAEALRLLDGLPGRGAGPAVSVRAALLRARAAKLDGDLDAVHRLLGRALREAGPEQLRRPFLEAGPWIAPFLATAPLRMLATGWLVTGATAGARPEPPRGLTGPTGLTGPPVEPLLEPLSARERDVLSRLARTMSTEEIAADLYVSVNTVKTHLKSAYRKLSVHRRNDAVRRARDLGLL